MNSEDRNYETARRAAAGVGLLTVIAGLLFGGLSADAELTEVLGFVITLVSLAGPKRRVEPPLSEEALSKGLEEQVRRRWQGEATARGLANRDFVPLRFVASG